MSSLNKEDTPTHSFQKKYYDDKYQSHSNWSAFKLLKRDKRLAWILPHIKKTDKVLDIGCGLGYIAHKISEKCSVATGVDISEKGIKLANDNFGSDKCRFINIDILELDSNEKINVAVMIELIEHLEDPATLLQKLHSLLDDQDGRLIITTPRGDRLTNRIRVTFGLSQRIDIYHVHEYNKEDMCKLLESAGFECVLTEYAGMDLPLPSRFYVTRRLRELICENAFGWWLGTVFTVFSNTVFYLAKKNN